MDRPDTKQTEPAKRKLYPRINFRVDEAERRQIEKDAAAEGMTVGSYLRWLAVHQPRTRMIRRLLPNERLLAQLKGEAGRVDGNLAQFLKLANRGEIVYTEELAEAAEAVRDFYKAAAGLLKEGQ